MKYIKTFENHSLDYSYEDAVSIFDPLRDYGYDISVEKETTDDWKMEEDYTEDYLSLIISKHTKSPSEFEIFDINGDSEESLEFRDCVIRVIDFLKDWSYHLDACYRENTMFSNLISRDVKLKDEKFVDSGTGDITKLPTRAFKIFFTRKTDKVQENLRHDIKDRFLDIEDEGYSVKIREFIDKPMNFGKEIKIHSVDVDHYLTREECEMMEIDISRGKSRRDRGEFLLSDIKETIKTSIDMVSGDYKVDCFYILTEDGHGGNGEDSNYYFKNLDDLPDRLTKLYIYFTK